MFSNRSVTVALLTLLSVAVSLLTLLIAGCTDIKQIRTADDPVVSETPHLSPEDKCDTGSAQSGENLRMIEEYKSHWLSYVEFSDQGWGYNSGQQMKHLEDRLKKSFKEEADDFLVIVFVHGWHHNAHDNDCNVNEFRVMLNVALERWKAGGDYARASRPRKIIGVYVGWRGESLDIPAIRYTTVMDRRSGAEHVAKGSIRDLFAMLRKHEIQENRERQSRVQTMVIGHSFGGLIAFHAVSQALVNELELSKRDREQGCVSARQKINDPSKRFVPPWPDLTVLINPAFEASRFEPVSDVTHASDSCGYLAGQLPSLVVVTADNDIWTGPVYAAFRAVSTQMEGYDETSAEAARLEREANRHTVGFVPRYRSHRMCLDESGSGAVAAFTPTTEPAPDEYSPAWVLGAPPEIVDKHDGFLYGCDIGSGKQSYLLNWLLDLQAYGPGKVLVKPGECGGWPQEAALPARCVR